MAIMESLVWLLVGYVVWSVIKGIWFIKPTKIIEQTEIIVYVEKRGSEYFAYLDDSQLFLAQGNTLTELIERIVQRTGSSEFVISANTDEDISNELVNL